MRDIAQINTTQPPDWTPTPEQLEGAGRNETYPAAGRTVAVPAAASQPLR